MKQTSQQTQQQIQSNQGPISSVDPYQITSQQFDSTIPPNSSGSLKLKSEEFKPQKLSDGAPVLNNQASQIYNLSTTASSQSNGSAFSNPIGNVPPGLAAQPQNMNQIPPISQYAQRNNSYGHPPNQIMPGQIRPQGNSNELIIILCFHIGFNPQMQQYFQHQMVNYQQQPFGMQPQQISFNANAYNQQQAINQGYSMPLGGQHQIRQPPFQSNNMHHQGQQQQMHPNQVNQVPHNQQFQIIQQIQGQNYPQNQTFYQQMQNRPINNYKQQSQLAYSQSAEPNLTSQKFQQLQAPSLHPVQSQVSSQSSITTSALSFNPSQGIQNHQIDKQTSGPITSSSSNVTFTQPKSEVDQSKSNSIVDSNHTNGTQIPFKQNSNPSSEQVKQSTTNPVSQTQQQNNLKNSTSNQSLHKSDNGNGATDGLGTSGLGSSNIKQLRGFELFRTKEKSTFSIEDFIIKNEITQNQIIPNLILTIGKKQDQVINQSQKTILPQDQLQKSSNTQPKQEQTLQPQIKETIQNLQYTATTNTSLSVASKVFQPSKQPHALPKKPQENPPYQIHLNQNNTLSNQGRVGKIPHLQPPQMVNNQQFPPFYHQPFVNQQQHQQHHHMPTQQQNIQFIGGAQINNMANQMVMNQVPPNMILQNQQFIGIQENQLVNQNQNPIAIQTNQQQIQPQTIQQSTLANKQINDIIPFIPENKRVQQQLQQQQVQQQNVEAQQQIAQQIEINQIQQQQQQQIASETAALQEKQLKQLEQEKQERIQQEERQKAKEIQIAADKQIQEAEEAAKIQQKLEEEKAQVIKEEAKKQLDLQKEAQIQEAKEKQLQAQLKETAKQAKVSQQKQQAPLQTQSAPSFKDKLLKSNLLKEKELDQVLDLIAQIKQTKEKSKQTSIIIPIQILNSFKDLSICKKVSKQSYLEESLVRQKKSEDLSNMRRSDRGGRGQGDRGNNRGGRGGNRGQPRPFNPNYNNPNHNNNNPNESGKIHNPYPNETSGFERPEEDEMTKKLKEESKIAIERAKMDKAVPQQIRLVVNQITPDNFDKKFSELRMHMFGDLKLPKEPGFDPAKDILKEQLIEDNMNLVVETIFRKAQREKAYLMFYGELCEHIIKLEMSLRGLKPTKKNIQNSNFRKSLLANCKSSFDQFFLPEVQIKRQTMDQEQMFKYRQTLFGNIQFVGELNRRQLLKETIIISVFDLLLAAESPSQEKFVNDDTVEGATVLMEKIGHIIEEQIEKGQPSDPKENQGPIRQPTQYQINHAQSFLRVFKRFEQLSVDEKISLRIRILVKNMLDNRANGWEKTKKQNEGGPKKIEDLRNELLAKAEEEDRVRMLIEEEENQSRDQKYHQRDRANTQNYKGKQGGDYRQQDYNQRNQRNSVRGTGRQDGKGNYNNSKNIGQASYQTSQQLIQQQQQAYIKKQPSQQAIEIVPIDDKEVYKRCFENFKTYHEQLESENFSSEEAVKEYFGLKFFQVYQDLKIINGRKEEEILFIFLQDLYDGNENMIEKSLPTYLSILEHSKAISKQSLAKGLSKLINQPPDSSIFEQSLADILFLLECNHNIVMKDITWPKPSQNEEDYAFVEGNYKMMAKLLVKIKQVRGEWKKVYQFFNSHMLDKSFKQMKGLILEKTLFSDISQELSEEEAKYILPLLEQDEEEIKKIDSSFPQ